MQKQTTLAARIWETLSVINVNEHVEKKGNLSYLSWTWAWSQLMEHFPDSYYYFDEHTLDNGTVRVDCVITIHDGEESVSRSGWLPVMDYKNKSIVNPDTRAISDARMRCLVKTIAFFGLGLYIYAGEDLPTAEKEDLNKPINESEANQLDEMLNYSGSDVGKFLSFYKVASVAELPKSHYEQAYNMLAKKIADMESATAQSDQELTDVDL